MPILLYLDDAPEVLILRAASLRLAGYNVITCDRPLKALAKLATSRVDVVVTDYDMPVLDGFAFADHARANGYKQPIVVCTGALNLPQGRAQSIDRIISKADHPSALANALQACLQRQTAINQSASAPAEDDSTGEALHFRRTS